MLIAQLSDLHLRSPGLPANRVVETNAMAARAFAMLASLNPQPDAVILSGDLADAGELDAYHLLAGLLRRYVRVPVHMVPGNHDNRAHMRAALGTWLQGYGPDPFIQNAVGLGPVRLVLLDSVAENAAHGELCAARLAFLEKALAAEPETPAVLVLHHPPIDVGIGHMDAIRLQNADALAEIMSRHPQVRAAWCGHVHRSINGCWAGRPVHIAPSVAHAVNFDLTPDAPPQLIMEPPAFLMHQWNQGEFVTHCIFVERYPGPYPFLSF